MMELQGHSSKIVTKYPQIQRKWIPRYELASILEKPEYTDKSMLIRTVLEDVKVVLVNAPCKFGRTSNINMLKRFLEIQVDQDGNRMKVEQTENYRLFMDNEEKLAICKDKVFFHKHFGQYPVIFLNFTPYNAINTYDRFMSRLRITLHGMFCSYEYLLEIQDLWRDELDMEDFKDYFHHGRFERLTEEQVKRGFRYLTQVLHKHFKRKVYVLVDNYDSLSVSFCTPDDMNNTTKRMMALFRGIISTLVKNNPHVDRVFLSGYSRIAGVGLSPDGNNIAYYPFLQDHDYVPFYGFTHDEVRVILDRFDMSDKLSEVEEWLGYKPVRSTHQKVYCTFSIQQYLESKRIRQFWTDGPQTNHLKGMMFLEEVSNEFLRFSSEAAIKTESVKKIHLSEVLHLKELFEVLPPVLAQKHDIALFMQALREFSGYFNVVRSEGNQLIIQPANTCLKMVISDSINSGQCSRTYKFDPENISTFCTSMVWLRNHDERTFILFRKSIEEMFANLTRNASFRKRPRRSRR